MSKQKAEGYQTKMLKVLLPDKDWDGTTPPSNYDGGMEGVWVALTVGAEKDGEGILLSRPCVPAYKGIGQADLVRFAELWPDTKAVIVSQLGAAERSPGWKGE